MSKCRRAAVHPPHPSPPLLLLLLRMSKGSLFVGFNNVGRSRAAHAAQTFERCHCHFNSQERKREGDI